MYLYLSNRIFLFPIIEQNKEYGYIMTNSQSVWDKKMERINTSDSTKKASAQNLSPHIFTCNKQKQNIIRLIHVIDKIYLSEYFTLISVYASVDLNPYCKLLNLTYLILCWCGFNQIRSAIDFKSSFCCWMSDHSTAGPLAVIGCRFRKLLLSLAKKVFDAIR